MSWATQLINQLQQGQTISCRPKGNSMSGKIESGQLVTISPSESYQVGDIVLCKVKGKQYLHLISAIKGNQFQISNNHGFVNGWITVKNIFGKVISFKN